MISTAGACKQREGERELSEIVLPPEFGKADVPDDPGFGMVIDLSHKLAEVMQENEQLRERLADAEGALKRADTDLQGADEEQLAAEHTADKAIGALIEANKEVFQLRAKLREAEEREGRAILRERAATETSMILYANYAKLADAEAVCEQMREVLLAWQQWEGDWINEASCWDREDGLPNLNQDLYDRWCAEPDNLQEQRNKALALPAGKYAERMRLLEAVAKAADKFFTQGGGVAWGRLGDALAEAGFNNPPDNNDAPPY